MMLGILGFFLLALAVPYAIAVATPSWRWLLSCGILVGGLLAYGWSMQIAVWHHPDFRAERLPLGPALLELLTISFAAGAAVRAVSLALARWAARPRWVTRAAVSFLGFAVLFAALTLPVVFDLWRQRSVSEACRRPSFRVEENCP